MFPSLTVHEMNGIQVQPSTRILEKDFLLNRNRSQLFNQFSRSLFSERKRIVGAQKDLVLAKSLKNSLEAKLIVYQTIHEKTSQVFFWSNGIVYRAQVGASSKAMRDPPKGPRKRSSPMSKSDSQLR